MSGSVVVVGGGPAGVLLTYLLARGGVPVTLLESRGDFARRFRGDSLAPSVLEYLDDLGLAQPLLADIPHTRADAFRWHTATRTSKLADFRWASRRFPYYALIPQAEFLPWLAERARGLGARIELGARVRSLLRADDGRVIGVGHTRDGVEHAVHADLVVGADGRSSKVRQLSGRTATELGASLDIAWLALPRLADDPPLSGLDLYAGPGSSIVLLGQGADNWQLGWDVPAGTFAETRTAVVEQIRSTVRHTLPWLAGRIDTLTDPNQLTLLPVRITEVDSWSEPGLLLIGDAAHVISPVGGNGINFALADAAEAANRLVEVLSAPPVDPRAVDAATAMVETTRRPAVTKEQNAQRRIEVESVQRLQARDPRPPGFLRFVAAVPLLPRLLGRTSRIAIPAPVAAIRDGRRATSARPG